MSSCLKVLPQCSPRETGENHKSFVGIIGNMVKFEVVCS
jgi:hypothetical protein